MLLSGLFNVKMLAELLDIGVIIGYGKPQNYTSNSSRRFFFFHLQLS